MWETVLDEVRKLMRQESVYHIVWDLWEERSVQTHRLRCSEKAWVDILIAFLVVYYA